MSKLVLTEGGLLVTDMVVKTKVAPVCHLARNTPYGRKDMYIAWSDKVEKFLGIPFAALMRENQEKVYKCDWDSVKKEVGTLRGKLADIQNMSFWKRLKFLFTQRL